MTTAPTEHDALAAIDDQCDVIVVPVNRWQGAIVRFVEHSALGDCTTRTVLEHDSVAVISARPVVTLSTGERQLWALLDDIITGDLADLLRRGDAQTLGSLGDLFARLTFAAAS